MKKLLLVSLAMFLFQACSSVYNEVTDSTGVFQLNRIDNIFFTNDNGLLITGVYHNKLTIIKTNSNFDTEWTKNNFEWGTNASGSGWGSSFYSVHVTKMFQQNDGTYVCVCSIEEGGDVVDYRVLAVELNAAGKQIRKVEFTNMNVVNALQTHDGGYVLFGTQLTKLNANYSQLWQKNIYDMIYFPARFIVTSDGGFAITGAYNSDQVYLKKYDSNGNELFSMNYKHNEYPFNEAGFDLVQLYDNGYLIVGRTRNANSLNDMDCQIIRTNLKGDTVWTKRFGDSTNDWLDRVVSYNQNEFIIQGTSGYPNENPKSLLFKIDYNGKILDSIKTQQFPVIVYSPLKYYIKAQNVDTAHVILSKIVEDKLFY